MKALILVGGYGTRLRPLTFKCPKPLVEFANKPILMHQIEALVKVGVQEIILAINYQPDTMKEQINKLQDLYKVKIICSQETEPLGTAGPIRLAKDHIIKDNPDGLFFVLNSDIICEFPLDKLLQFHKQHNHEGTIFVNEVDDPSKYGVILADETGRIKDFIEKPQEFISNKINSGLYLFNISMIDRIPLKPTSIEREIFPIMAKEGQLYQYILPGFWKDVGQPKDYLAGTVLILESYKTHTPDVLAKGNNIVGNVLIDASAQIDPNAVIGPNVIIGPDCQVKEGVRLKNCVLLKGVIINANSWINESIIGWSSTIGKWVRIEGVSVCGEDVQVKDEVYINQSFILPHRGITSNIYNKNTVIM
ncbi:unnamed protein product [Paramecium primaurelia]|uniref:mannose-1-phosphate guanylyltransferase n=1 Tax=Paramecium primaurelia TaxID=5886 RepID=A0A8S1JRS3_PARPR|nr:unnamed protein product [Paramecium primaurelia]